MLYRRLLTAFIAIILVSGNLWIDRWDNTLYHGDSCFYYMHVVSAFIHHDVGDYDRTITTLREVNPDSADPREDEFGVRLTDIGRRYIKYTLGVPVLETPFFLLGHLYAKASPEYEANGWTRPYAFAVSMAIPFYVTLGFWLLTGLLQRYFSTAVVVITSLALVLATNLFYQATYVIMSHGFLFFLHCWLLHATFKFWDRPGWGRALLLGLIVGVIALTRAPEVVAALVPVVWGISGWDSFKERLTYLGKNIGLLLPAVAGFLVGFSLQFAYWYYVSGQLIFNPYDGEGFDFLNVRLAAAFFGFDNGWLIYTPIMVFSLTGLFMLPKRAPGWLLPILAFVVLQCWIHYSYYVYSYFPGLGQRPMVDTYPYLAFGLAAAFGFLWKFRWLKWIPAVAVIGFGALNIFQTWQSREGYLWTEYHNEAFYRQSFGKTSHSLNQLRAFYVKVFQPEESDIVLVDTLAQDGFEGATEYVALLDSTVRRTGRYGINPTEDYLNLAVNLSLPDVSADDYLRVGIYGYLKPHTEQAGRWAQAALVVSFKDETATEQAYYQAPIGPFVNNETYNIYRLGLEGKWGEASYYVPVPEGAGPGWTVTAFVINTPKQNIWLDDFWLGWYRQR